VQPSEHKQNIKMAKFARVALCLFAMLVASAAAEEFMGFAAGRKLQQSYTCSQAKLLTQSGQCDAILACAGPKDSRVQKASKLFAASCAKCVAAVASSLPSCKGSFAVPKDCQSGLGIKAVADCINSRASVSGH